jgi:hypothetical protein
MQRSGKQAGKCAVCRGSPRRYLQYITPACIRKVQPGSGHRQCELKWAVLYSTAVVLVALAVQHCRAEGGALDPGTRWIPLCRAAAAKNTNCRRFKSRFPCRPGNSPHHSPAGLCGPHSALRWEDVIRATKRVWAAVSARAVALSSSGRVT